jgi:hypothetical protein
LIRIINKILLNKKEIQRQYDEETLHGIINSTQKEWEEKVHIELLELEKYAVNYEEQEICDTP